MSPGRCGAAISMWHQLDDFAAAQRPGVTDPGSDMRSRDAKWFICPLRRIGLDCWTSANVPGCSAAWLARLTGGQEVEGSNPSSPTLHAGDSDCHRRVFFDRLSIHASQRPIAPIIARQFNDRPGSASLPATFRARPRLLACLRQRIGEAARLCDIRCRRRARRGGLRS